MNRMQRNAVCDFLCLVLHEIRRWWREPWSALFIVLWTEASHYTRTPKTFWNIWTMESAKSPCPFCLFSLGVVLTRTPKLFFWLRRFSSDSKKNPGFFSNLYGQMPHLWTNRGKKPKSCPSTQSPFFRESKTWQIIWCCRKFFVPLHIDKLECVLCHWLMQHALYFSYKLIIN